MTLKPTQPRSGHLSSQSKNPKRQPPKRDSGMKANIGAIKGSSQVSDNHPDFPSENRTNKVRPDVRGQNERGYVKNSRVAGEKVHNTSAGRIRKIKG